jgi:hypothetical protein
MAARLMKYYEYAKQKGGMQAQMRLAMKTGIPSTKAPGEPDSQELLEKFHSALREILNDPSLPKF